MKALKPSLRKRAAFEDEPHFHTEENMANDKADGKRSYSTLSSGRQPRNGGGRLATLNLDEGTTEHAQDLIRSMDPVILAEFIAAVLEAKMAVLVSGGKDDLGVLITVYDQGDRRFYSFPTVPSADQGLEKLARILLT